MISLDDLTMYVYGLLEDPADEAMKDHLGSCRPCREFAALISSEHRLFEGALAREIPDTATRTAAVEAILARRPSRPPPAPGANPAPVSPPRRTIPLLRPASLFATAFAAMLLLTHFASWPHVVARVPVATLAPDPDLSISTHWDSPSVVELEVMAPDGEELPSRFLGDSRTCAVPRTSPGVYRVLVRLKSGGRTTVKAVVRIREGDERRESTVILDAPGDQQFLRDITVDR